MSCADKIALDVIRMNRPRTMTINVTSEERAFLESKAKEFGCTMSFYIKAKVFNGFVSESEKEQKRLIERILNE